MQDKLKQLQAAIVKNCPDHVRRLLAEGADPDGGGEFRPLWDATAGGQAQIARILLEAGARADIVVNSQKGALTPLMEAASNGDKEMLDLLLPHSNPEQAAGRWRWTALQHAAASNRAGALECLVALAAVSDAARVDPRGRNALHLAAEASNAMCVEFLSEKLDMEATDNAGLNALTLAALSVRRIAAHGEEAFFWLAERATPKMFDAQDQEGMTALMHFAEFGRIEHAFAVLDMSDQSLADKKGRTAFHIACLRTKIAHEPFATDFCAFVEEFSELVSDAEITRAASLLARDKCPRVWARAESMALRAELAQSLQGAAAGLADEGHSTQKTPPAKRL